MTKKERQLLLIDLCGRLPYGVKIRINNKQPNRIYTLNCYDESDYYDEGYKFDAHSGGRTEYGLKIKDFKPFLRQMSSMTEEEQKQFDGKILPNGYVVASNFGFDFLNKNHFDYRGLIERGFALPAPDGMYR